MDVQALKYESEEELYRFIRCLGDRAGVAIHAGPHYRWIDTSPAISPNVVFDLCFEEADIEAGLGGAIRRVERGEIPPAWIIAPRNRPAGLARLLEQNGFKAVVAWSGMALDLDKIEDEPPPAGVEVQPLETDAWLPEWTAVVTLNLFGGKPEHVAPQTELYRKVLGSERLRFHAARLGGEVAATAILFLDGGVAGIHAVSTRSDCRRRGVGRAVTLAALLEAKRCGACRAVLQASALGEAVYRKMGFEEECRMAIYRHTGVAP